MLGKLEGEILYKPSETSSGPANILEKTNFVCVKTKLSLQKNNFLRLKLVSFVSLALTVIYICSFFQFNIAT